jgi:hypothetical protein
MRTLELGFALCEIGGLGITGASFGRDTRVVKEGMLELGFALCAKGAGAVCGSTTVGYGPDPAKSWQTRLSKSRRVNAPYCCYSRGLRVKLSSPTACANDNRAIRYCLKCICTLNLPEQTHLLLSQPRLPTYLLQVTPGIRPNQPPQSARSSMRRGQEYCCAMQTSSTGALQTSLIPGVRVDHQRLAWLPKIAARMGQTMPDMGGRRGQFERGLGRVGRDPFVILDKLLFEK